MKNIVLLSPLKDELINIDRFISSLENQSIRIKGVIILENDSSDGSKEYLDDIKFINNVDFFKVLNLNLADKSYNLEHKYSKIVSEGIRFIEKLPFYDEINYIGILDADCFPENKYYEKLLNYFESNKSLGITSGRIFTHSNNLHIANPSWVRGGCRLWDKGCLEDTGFPIEPSPDTITVALAEIKGWDVKVCDNAKVISREVNDRLTNFKNFGRRAYYRGHTIFFALLKSFHFLLKMKPIIAYDYLIGFLDSYIKKKDKINDERILNYYKFYLVNNFRKKLRIKKEKWN